jgi:hypothetical protein
LLGGKVAKIARKNARKCPEVRAGALNLPVSRNGSKVVPRPKGGFPKGKIREKIFPKKIFPGQKNLFPVKKNFAPIFWVGIFLGRGFFQLGNPDEECGIRKRAVVCILCE